MQDITGYRFDSASLGHEHAYLLPTIEGILSGLSLPEKRCFDLGCGNGSVAHWLSTKGFSVAGVDPSTTGIAAANQAHPELELKEGSCYDPLSDSFGTFPLVVSLEVVEHVYAPRDYARCVWDLLEPGGVAVISTPYHGYLKNLALAVTGKMDSHFTALWDHGHIKFWSVATLVELLRERGFVVEQVHRVGRVKWLAKSMVLVARRSV